MNKSQLCHVCLSSSGEVMFRSDADLRMGFNCLAAAVLSTESQLLAEGFMTTHYHGLLITHNLKQVVRRHRYAYSRYFNTKYYRSGRLGEKHFFCLEIGGFYHTLSALNYVNRQGLHHGLAATPFGYKHCSANSFFRSDLGKDLTPELLPDEERYKHLPSNVKIPCKYRMSKEGLLLREDIIDVPYVEHLYTSPKSFLFQMNKASDENDLRNQQNESDKPAITIDAIEMGVPGFTAKEAKMAEFGKVNHSMMSDLELCAYIDNELVPRVMKGHQEASIYLIPDYKRAELCESLWNESKQVNWRNDCKSIFSGKYITRPQLCRCMCVKPS